MVVSFNVNSPKKKIEGRDLILSVYACIFYIFVSVFESYDMWEWRPIYECICMYFLYFSVFERKKNDE